LAVPGTVSATHGEANAVGIDLIALCD